MQLVTNENFNEKIKNGIVVVDFFATWCWPCKMIAPYLEKMETQYAGKVSFYKVDVDKQQYLSATQEIRAMPTLKVFRNGINEETIVWADLDGLVRTIDRLLQSEANK